MEERRKKTVIEKQAERSSKIIPVRIWLGFFLAIERRIVNKTNAIPATKARLTMGTSNWARPRRKGFRQTARIIEGVPRELRVRHSL